MKRSALGFALTILMAAIPAAAQSSAGETPKFEVSAEYTWVRARAVTSTGCCFSMNGGDASVAYNLNSWFGLVGDFGGFTNGNVLKSGLGLTVYPYTFGPRISIRKYKALTPFGEALFGGGHATGTLYTNGFTPATPKNAFAMQLGGGVDANVNRHFAIRLAEVDYLFTDFVDGFTNHEHNLKISAGAVFRFGGH
jgi:Outer membrane protein beta-barrel domain